MLNLTGHTRLFLCQHPVNMKKSFEGLSKEVENLFPGELLSGAYFIFLNRRRDHMKVLLWDSDGFLIYFKRLEKGTFRWKWGESSSLNRRDFLMLLEGVTPKRLDSRFFFIV